MAITNAQQYQQLVNPPMKGKKRPGYRGDAAARSTGAKQSGRADPGSRGDPGEGQASRDSGVSEATGGFAPTRGVSANVGPTGRDDLVRQSLVNQAKEFRKQQQEKRKGLNTAEKFRVNRLKKLYESKVLPQQKGFIPFGAQFLQSLTPPKLNVYDEVDPAFDMSFYGLTGDEITDADRLAKAINKAESTGIISQSEFEDAFFGPEGPPQIDQKDQGIIDPCKGPNPPAYCFIGTKATETLQAQAERTDPTRFYRIMADGGMTEDAPMIQGGLTDLAMRDEFFVGGIVKGIKKSLKGVTRAVKKVAKSPIGKAALFAAAGSYGLGLSPFQDKAGAGFLKSAGLKDFFIKKGGGLTDKGIIAALTSAPFVGEILGLNKQKDENIDLAEGPRLDTEAEPFYRLAAEGGLMRAGYQEGSKEPVAKKTMPLLDMGGQEMDLRDEGGFVPIGRMEKADDVPARLSKNEFVFTADAVRNAGDGNVDKGAEVMYNMMKNLEAGGDVSEESQGLKGAREMFQTSQRLGEVI
jgi:hypothetical protein